MLFDLAVVALLILLNGLLAMAELAVVSSSVPRLQVLHRRAVAGAHAALQLKEAPGRFLSTVQIGITGVSVLAGAFSGATLAEPLAQRLERYRWLGGHADDVALALVVVVVTYLSLIGGELVPKRIALRHPERIAALSAPALLLLARLGRPLVWLLDVSSALLLRFLPRHENLGTTVTDEEIHALVAEAASAGVVEPEEKMLIAAIMRLADRRVRAVMRRRQELDWIDLDAPVDVQRARLRASPHTKLVAARGHIDQFVGLISAKRLVDTVLDGAAQIEPGANVVDALVLPDSIDAFDAIVKLRGSPLHAAIVVDEFGSLQGLVTVNDILSAIAGELYLDQPPGIFQRADGSWLVDGELPAAELVDKLQVPLPAERSYETAAGLMLHLLGHMPQLGASAWLGEWRFEVLDLDGRRIDKLLVRREVPAERAG